MDEELNEIAVNIDLDQEWDDDEIIPASDNETSIPPPSPQNIPYPSDSGDSSDAELLDEEEEVEIPAQHPPRPMKLVGGLKEFDEDYANGWEIIWHEDPGFEDGLPPFTGSKGTNIDGVAPMDFFNFLFKDSMWGHIVNQTNEYALRKKEILGPDAVVRMEHADYKKFARLNQWKPVTLADIRIFAAHLILLGLVRKPELSDYWSHNELTRTPFFGTCMSRDRFQAILSNFHVADDRGNPPHPHPQHKPLAKVQPFIDMCNTQFRAAFNPGENISIDEGCCPWRGRLRFKQFNPRKPNKYHIKIFQVSDPNSGYLIHFKIYTGAGSCHRDGVCSYDGQSNTTTKTVMTLCEDAHVLDKGHCIYMDNFFTSVSLAEELFSRQTLCCGTVRHRIGQPLLLGCKDALKLKPGLTCALRSGPVLCFKWVQDKSKPGKQSTKEVYMLTTKHLAEELYSGKILHRTGEPIYKPSAVVEYCHEMGGVDLTDQLLEYYHFLRRSCKWWRKLWVHIFNMVILNAFILNKSFGWKKHLSQTEYRYIIAMTLLDHTPLVDDPSNSMPQQTDGHWPERLPISITAKTPRRKVRKCAYCFVSAKKAAKGATRKESSTTIICSSCRVPLCVFPCFGKYHIDKYQLAN
jgi:hypothetical protein